MLGAPPPVDASERARAEVTERAEQILEDTERDVEAELERMEAAKSWALAEMDRITERAKEELGDGKDPDEVRRRTEADLAAVIEKANDPEFDPRTKEPPTPPAAAAKPRPPEQVPARPASPMTETRPLAPPPAAAETPPLSPPEPTPNDAPGCTCRSAPDASGSGAALLFSVVFVGRPRRAASFTVDGRSSGRGSCTIGTDARLPAVPEMLPPGDPPGAAT